MQKKTIVFWVGFVEPRPFKLQPHLLTTRSYYWLADQQNCVVLTKHKFIIPGMANQYLSDLKGNGLTRMLYLKVTSNLQLTAKYFTRNRHTNVHCSFHVAISDITPPK